MKFGHLRLGFAHCAQFLQLTLNRLSHTKSLLPGQLESSCRRSIPFAVQSSNACSFSFTRRATCRCQLVDVGIAAVAELRLLSFALCSIIRTVS